MAPRGNPALDHIHAMRHRIEQQNETTNRLKATGEDTTKAFERLTLLYRAMGGIRAQLDSLASKGFDAKRPVNTKK
jgi:hypothetical protein